jgi:hypothetical protein
MPGILWLYEAMYRTEKQRKIKAPKQNWDPRSFLGTAVCTLESTGLMGS